ncbi:hypothetical protein [Marinifilum sp.]|uniref:hypothetical protein n=1 Tax=Marinifilum sp. TaxID=2033137 RepID=UPI003BABD7F8
MKKALIIYILAFVCLTSAKAQTEWEKITSEKSKISFSIPDQPFIQNKMLNGISTEVFSFKDAITVFGLVASDLSKLGLDFTYSDPSAYYQEMKEGSLVSRGTILIGESSVAYQKMLGKEIQYTQMVGKHEYTYFKRFFFRGKYIYQITIGGPSRMKKILLNKKNIYFNSIFFL